MLQNSLEGHTEIDRGYMGRIPIGKYNLKAHPKSLPTSPISKAMYKEADHYIHFKTVVELNIMVSIVC